MEDFDGDEIAIEFVAVKYTGEVVTDWAFESGVLKRHLSDIRSQCWDQDLDDQIDDLI